MNRIKDFDRLNRIINEVIETLDINLDGMNVLTEIASGNFIVTSLIAAMAGASKVYVVCRDSVYGSVDVLHDYFESIVDYLNIDRRRFEYVDDKAEVAGKVNIVTNSGFVRPIDETFIKALPCDAAIPLMFESWEFRPGDIDIDACIKCNIPVLGTNENHSDLHIFRYVAMSVLKLLFEKEIEVYKSKILLISSGDYMREINTLLTQNEAEVCCIDTYKADHISEDQLSDYVEKCDAIVFAEQENKRCLLGDHDCFIDISLLQNTKPCIIHIAGVLDYNYMKRYNIEKYPSKEVDYGYMTVTTDYVGMRPVIELNAAGIKVGQALVEGMRKKRNYIEAQKYALQHSPAMMFDMHTCKKE